MKVYFVTSVCRQVQGDMINIRFEKAFKDNEKAFAYANALNKTYLEQIRTTDTEGKAYNTQFCCERSVHELEIEE